MTTASAKQKVITDSSMQRVNSDVNIVMQALLQDPRLHASRDENTKREIPHSTHSAHRVAGICNSPNNTLRNTLRGPALQRFFQIRVDTIKEPIPQDDHSQKHSVLLVHD